MNIDEMKKLEDINCKIKSVEKSNLDASTKIYNEIKGK